MIKKWKLISSRFVLNEKWYRVRKDTVEIRPGQVIDDYYLGIFNDLVMIIAITKDNRIPLVRQYKHGAGKILTELPAGYINDNEEPLAAAQRELREETGFTSTNWQHLGFFYKNSSKSSGNNVHLFLAQGAEKTGEQQLDETENIEIIMTPFEEAASLAWQGELKGIDSAMAVILAEKELKNG